jgi:hypothetical protein
MPWKNALQPLCEKSSGSCSSSSNSDKILQALFKLELFGYNHFNIFFVPFHNEKARSFVYFQKEYVVWV